MESTRRAKAEAMKSHIADVAMEMFAERGFSATSTRKIAKQAGVSEGLIFHHFGTKMGLLRGAAARSGALSTHIAQQLADAPDAPVQEQLARIAQGFTAFLRADRLGARVFRVLMAESATNEALYALQQERTRQAVDGLAAYLASRVDAGELRADLSVTSAAQMLLGSFLWFFFTHMHLSAAEWTTAAEAHAEAVVDQWLRGALAERCERAP